MSSFEFLTLTTLWFLGSAMKMGKPQELPSAVTTQDKTIEFVDYCSKYGKEYKDQAEFQLRLENFSQQDRKIKELNDAAL